jgi:hypothetical protein
LQGVAGALLLGDGCLHSWQTQLRGAFATISSMRASGRLAVAAHTFGAWQHQPHTVTARSQHARNIEKSARMNRWIVRFIIKPYRRDVERTFRQISKVCVARSSWLRISRRVRRDAVTKVSGQLATTKDDKSQSVNKFDSGLTL